MSKGKSPSRYFTFNFHLSYTDRISSSAFLGISSH